MAEQRDSLLSAPPASPEGTATEQPAPDLRRVTAGVIVELELDEEVDRLRRHIEAWIDKASEEMQEALRWQFLGQSKHYRPLTVFACYRSLYSGRVPDQVIRSAVAVELFHNMSLIIDDILDRSRHRRGKLTLHCRYGNLRALMTSGYVVADGYELVIDDPHSIALLSELIKRLGVAECLQWRLRRQPLGVEDWRIIAGEDTGSMFEVCACLGARGEKLRRFGHLLGLLYHGCDDVGDVRGLEALGGGGEQDIRDGILTLPASLAVRDPKIAVIFANPGPQDEPTLLQAFQAQLPAAEACLDEIAEEAKTEARLFSHDPERLLLLAEKVRTLSSH